MRNGKQDFIEFIRLAAPIMVRQCRRRIAWLIAIGMLLAVLGVALLSQTDAGLWLSMGIAGVYSTAGTLITLALIEQGELKTHQRMADLFSSDD